MNNNNKMDTELLVEMRHSGKCGGVMTDEILNLPVVFGASP